MIISISSDNLWEWIDRLYAAGNINVLYGYVQWKPVLPQYNVLFCVKYMHKWTIFTISGLCHQSVDCRHLFMTIHAINNLENGIICSSVLWLLTLLCLVGRFKHTMLDTMCSWEHELWNIVWNIKSVSTCTEQSFGKLWMWKIVWRSHNNWMFMFECGN